MMRTEDERCMEMEVEVRFGVSGRSKWRLTDVFYALTTVLCCVCCFLGIKEPCTLLRIYHLLASGEWAFGRAPAVHSMNIWMMGLGETRRSSSTNEPPTQSGTGSRRLCVEPLRASSFFQYHCRAAR